MTKTISIPGYQPARYWIVVRGDEYYVRGQHAPLEGTWTTDAWRASRWMVGDGLWNAKDIARRLGNGAVAQEI